MSIYSHLICIDCKEGIFVGKQGGLFHHEDNLKIVDEFLIKHATYGMPQEEVHKILFWVNDDYFPGAEFVIDGIKEDLPNNYGQIGPIKV